MIDPHFDGLKSRKSSKQGLIICTYVGTHVHESTYGCEYRDGVEIIQIFIVCMYICTPDAWAFSINYKSADRSTFAMYWGTFVKYPSFCKWHYLI